MNKNKDIQQLIDRFMAGQTSLEEEQQLADYLRSRDIPSEWKVYKEMFDYFDEGMPAGRYDVKKGTKRSGRSILFAIVSAAAVVAILFTLTWKGQDSTSPQIEKTQPVATLTPDTTLNTNADTTSIDTENAVPVNREKPRSLKNRYRMMMPKSYYADAKSNNETSIDDSIARDEMLLTMKLKNIERMEELIARQIELTETTHNIEIALALENEEDE